MKCLIKYIILVLLFFGCKSESNRVLNKLPKKNEEVTKTIVISSDNKTFKQNQKKVDNVEQKNLDYSLKSEDVKTRIDSVLFLKHYFNQFSKEKDSLSEVFFFKMFPENFKMFKSIYGYEENQEITIYGDLYENYEQIIDYEPKYIKTEEYIKKLIDISVRGAWQSDNVAHLQNIINILFNKNSRLFTEILKNKDESEIMGFWKFFFDGPNPDNQKKLYDDVLNKLKKSEEMMIPIIRNAYAKVKEDWKKH